MRNYPPGLKPAEVQARARAAGEEMVYQWPYPWVYMPPNGRPELQRAAVAVPNYGTANQVAVITYQVPQGFEFVLTHVMHSLVNGANWVDGDGNIVWDIDVNRPVGASLITGYGIPGYTAMTTSLGSPAQPWPVSGAWRFSDNETIRYKVRTVAVVGVGAPRFIHAALLGWIYPPKRR